jgi:cbb3-type cytochrome oxidase subunit 3
MRFSKQKTQGIDFGMFAPYGFAILVVVMAMILILYVSSAIAEEDETEFDEATIYFELNDTDGDLGIHALIDGDGWKRLEIEDPMEREMLNIRVKGRLKRQGLTELFFESAEPTFDELAPETFFRRFPEGEYEIEGITLDGEELESTAYLSHVMPAPPANVKVNGDGPVAEDCEEEPAYIVNDTPVTISWDDVMESHPELGKTGDVDVEIYQVVVEQEDLELVFSVDLPPETTEVEIPESFTDLGEEFKFEILVREASGNQTAVESCFEVAE